MDTLEGLLSKLSITCSEELEADLIKRCHNFTLQNYQPLMLECEQMYHKLIHTNPERAKMFEKLYFIMNETIFYHLQDERKDMAESYVYESDTYDS